MPPQQGKRRNAAVYGLPDRMKKPSAAEEQVLLALWAVPAPAGRAEIARALPRQAGAQAWADATVLNFLYRLEEKGWVRTGRQGNRNVYTPAVSRRAYGVYVMRERLAAVFGGDLAAAVSALVSESGAGLSELEKARAALDEKLEAAQEYDLYDPYG
jgi:BlaI family penicillinase repressor